MERGRTSVEKAFFSVVGDKIDAPIYATPHFNNMRISKVTIMIAEHAGDARADVFKQMLKDVFPDIKTYKAFYIKHDIINTDVVLNYLKNNNLTHTFTIDDIEDFIYELDEWHTLPEIEDWECEINEWIARKEQML
jgi:hypothetical protein